MESRMGPQTGSKTSSWRGSEMGPKQFVANFGHYPTSYCQAKFTPAGTLCVELKFTFCIQSIINSDLKKLNVQEKGVPPFLDISTHWSKKVHVPRCTHWHQGARGMQWVLCALEHLGHWLVVLMKCQQTEYKRMVLHWYEKSSFFEP